MGEDNLDARALQAIRFGVARGIFSNESGLGSAGIAAHLVGRIALLVDGDLSVGGGDEVDAQPLAQSNQIDQAVRQLLADPPVD